MVRAPDACELPALPTRDLVEDEDEQAEAPTFLGGRITEGGVTHNGDQKVFAKTAPAFSSLTAWRESLRDVAIRAKRQWSRENENRQLGTPPAAFLLVSTRDSFAISS
jgi:hypothetical protein